MTHIAVLGTGAMGAAIARRLLDRGHRVTVWNRTGHRCTSLVHAGAAPAGTPAHAVAEAQVIITSLRDAEAADAVWFGTDGGATALRPAQVVVETSTVGPDAARQVAARLPAGVTFVDAPLVGSADAVAAGTVQILAGGPWEEVATVLHDLGSVHPVGDVGDAAAVKLAVNAALATAVVGIAEALTVADATAVAREVVLEALARGPLGAVVARTQATGARFGIRLAHKDAELALRAVTRAGRAAPALHATAQQLRHHVTHGLAEADISRLVRREMP
ncbi:NAD(P)-dependent oxidoreductase [Micromonospora sp. KC213]|uniref:NAD(P)-dependent oxidoreductase n=1 Tax=Micromonospora sp. KC213 TaxID=2530378 RepID=UPI0014044DC3|nr:NAD(P)-dependent oxidoreductase [Micromonospora sp. KC213]